MTPSRDRRILAAILVALVAFTVIPGLAYGIFRSYLQYPDADISFPYWALLLNEGMPLNWYDHPGFFYNLLLAKWYSVLKALGLIAIDSFLELPDRNAFEPAYAQLVYAARVLAIVQAGAFAVVCLLGMRVLVKRLDLAVGATLLALVAPPVALLMLIVRSELLSAIAMFGAFFALVAAAHARSQARQGWLLAMVGFASLVAVETKVIAAVPLFGSFLIAPLFATGARPAPLDPGARRLVILAGLALVFPFVGDAIRLWDGARFDHFAIVGAVGVALGGLVWRRQGTVGDGIVAASWLLGGIGAAYLINAAHYESGNIKAILYVVDHVTIQVDAIRTTMEAGIVAALLTSFGQRILAIANNIWVAPVYGATLVVLIAAAARRDWLLAAKIGLLVGLDLATAAIFGLRGSDQYAICFYFWTVMALAIGVEPIVNSERTRPLAVKAGWLAVILLVGGQQVRNLDPLWPPTSADNACVQARNYVHRLRDYWDHYCPNLRG